MKVMLGYITQSSKLKHFFSSLVCLFILLYVERIIICFFTMRIGFFLIFMLTPRSWMFAK